MKMAPDFTLPDQAGALRNRGEFLGSWWLVYFYPQDDTPGCTTEACEFRDVYGELEREGLKVVGVSTDSAESHAKFAQKHHLNFPLLADVESEMSGAYGAKGLFGAKRMTFLVNPEGEIAEVYPKVDPSGHAREILRDFKTLRDGQGH